MRLRKSAPCLDNTRLVFNSAGTVAYAVVRNAFEDLRNKLLAKRQRFNAISCFRTVCYIQILQP